MSDRRHILTQELREAAVDAALVVRVFDLSAGQPQKAPFTVFDLSSYFTGGLVQMVFNRPDDPDGTPNAPHLVTATATTITTLDGYVGDGSDGYAQFLTPDATWLTPAGIWRWQVRISGVGAGVYKSQIVTRRVFPNLAEV